MSDSLQQSEHSVPTGDLPGAGPVSPPLPPSAGAEDNPSSHSAWDAADVAPRRPGMVTAAAAVLLAAGVLALVFAGVSLWLAIARGSGDDPFRYEIRSAAMAVALCAVSVVAAVLVVRGRDAGRTLAFAIAGVLCWFGAGSVLYLAVEPFLSGGAASWTDLDTVFGALALGALGVAAILMLANREVVDWFSDRRAGTR